MPDEIQCGDCGKPMEMGFIPEMSHGSLQHVYWYPGDPEEQSMHEWRPEQLRFEGSPARRVLAYRCPACHTVKLVTRD